MAPGVLFRLIREGSYVYTPITQQQQHGAISHQPVRNYEVKFQ